MVVYDRILVQLLRSLLRRSRMHGSEAQAAEEDPIPLAKGIRFLSFNGRLSAGSRHSCLCKSVDIDITRLLSRQKLLSSSAWCGVQGLPCFSGGMLLCKPSERWPAQTLPTHLTKKACRGKSPKEHCLDCPQLQPPTTFLCKGS